MPEGFHASFSDRLVNDLQRKQQGLPPVQQSDQSVEDEFTQALRKCFEDGVRLGREEGLNVGRHEGHRHGASRGLKQGRQEGFNQGREKGFQHGIEVARSQYEPRIKAADEQVSALEEQVKAYSSVELHRELSAMRALSKNLLAFNQSRYHAPMHPRQCTTEEDSVLTCLSANSAEPLTCRSLVDQYVLCTQNLQ